MRSKWLLSVQLVIVPACLAAILWSQRSHKKVPATEELGLTATETAVLEEAFAVTKKELGIFRSVTQEL